jgi:hypothetical protein
MNDLRSGIDTELRNVIVPELRSRGFKGSYPHFRRIGEKGIDLWTFQFDRNGGGLVIEIAQSPLSGVTTHWGEEIPPNKVTAWDIHPDSRQRLKPKDGSGTDSWFRFEDGNFERVSKQVLSKLPAAEEWWRTHV